MMINETEDTVVVAVVPVDIEGLQQKKIDSN